MTQHAAENKVIRQLRWRHTERRWNGREYEAWLRIGCQSFRYAATKTLREAEWWQTQMAAALRELLTEGKKKRRP